MEVTRGADHHLLVPHFNRIVDMGETGHASYAPTMAQLMNAEQDNESSKGSMPQLHCEQQGLPDLRFVYYNDPYHAAAIIQGQNTHLPVEGQLSYHLPFPNPNPDDDEDAVEQGVKKTRNMQQRTNLGLATGAAGTTELARSCDKSKALNGGDMVGLCSSEISSVSKSEVMDLAMSGDAGHVPAMGMASKLNSESVLPAESSLQTDERMKGKILQHPDYQRLLMAYVSCCKVGAPPDVVRRLEELNEAYNSKAQLLNMVPSKSRAAATDPELDHFMNTYCHILQEYEEALSKPFNDAMAFLHKIELQINQLVPNGEFRSSQTGDDRARLSVEDMVERLEQVEEEQEVEEEEEGASFGEVLDYENVEGMGLDQQAEDKQLKEQLLRKYKGYISTLKHEFMKKKKKGKLPKDARQRLLDWWHEHYKWPYPSEMEKVTLAETTGLDQKQINNWFINQRKRHWKPSDQDVRYVMVNGQDPPTQAEWCAPPPTDRG